MELKGTKEVIFDVAVNMIARNGYENVSMRDIAKEVGIKPASIYSHYKGKEQLLDTIYEYFIAHRKDTRRPDNLVKATIETGTAYEIAYALYNSSFSTDEKRAVRLILIYKILLMRIFNDPKANDVFLNKMYEEDYGYLMKWLQYGIKIGRLDKEYDIETYASFYYRQLIMMALMAFVNPNYVAKKADEEERIIRMLGDMLPLKASVGAR